MLESAPKEAPAGQASQQKEKDHPAEGAGAAAGAAAEAVQRPAPVEVDGGGGGWPPQWSKGSSAKGSFGRGAQGGQEGQKEVRIAPGAGRQQKDLLDLDEFKELVAAGLPPGEAVPRIASPHSLAAMQKQGVVEEDLLPRDFEEFLVLDKRESNMVAAALRRHDGVVVDKVLQQHVERFVEIEMQ